MNTLEIGWKYKKIDERAWKYLTINESALRRFSLKIDSCIFMYFHAHYTILGYMKIDEKVDESLFMKGCNTNIKRHIMFDLDSRMFDLEDNTKNTTI